MSDIIVNKTVKQFTVLATRVAGPRGYTGESAYQYAVRVDGFVGTQVEYYAAMQVRLEGAQQAQLGAELAKGLSESAKEISITKANEALLSKEGALVAQGLAESALQSAIGKAAESLNSANAALLSEQNALVSEQLAKGSEDNAKQSELNSLLSEQNALNSFNGAGIRAELASQYKNDAEFAQGLAKAASEVAISAKESALASANTATIKSGEALVSKDAAKISETNSANAASSSQVAKAASETAQGLSEVAKNLSIAAKESALASATTATTKAGEASQSAINANNAKTAAENATTSKVDKTSVKQIPGMSTTDLMSQKTVSEITTGEALQLLYDHNSVLIFQGFADTTSATPAHSKNNAWIATQTGTIFGIPAVQGQIVRSTGTSYVAEYFSNDNPEKYTNVLDPEQFRSDVAYNFSNGAAFQLLGSTATGHQKSYPGKKYTIRCGLGDTYASMMYFYDRNKSFITNTSNNPELVVSSDSGKTKIFTTPTNCHFISFCRYSTSLLDFTKNITLTLGEEWFAWEAYKSKLISHYKANKTEVAASFAEDAERMTGINDSIAFNVSFLLDTKVSFDDSILPNRINTMETSENPGFLKTQADPSSWLYCGHEVDTISPLRKFGLGYLRYMYSGTATSGNCFIHHNLPVGAPAARPIRIEWSFWVKDDNLKECWPVNTTMNFSLNDFANIAIPNVNNFIDKFNNKTTAISRTGSTSTMFSDYSFYFEVLIKYKGWTKLVLRMYNLVWKPAFTGTVAFGWYIYWNALNANLFNKKFYFTNHEVFHNYEMVSGMLYNYPSIDGNIKYPIDIEGDLIKTNKNILVLDTEVADIDSRLKTVEVSSIKKQVLYNAGYVYMRDYFSATKDIVVSITSIGQPSSTLINKTDAINASGVRLNPLSDDSAPININGIGYIGGGHGLSAVREITSANHGKTVADIGSVWGDTNGYQHVILSVISTSVIYTLSKNYGTSIIYEFKFPTAGTSLVHVSGAINTSSIPVTSLVSLQLPSRRDITTIVKIDGAVVSENSIPSYAKKIERIEGYGISDPVTMMEKLITNRPIDGYVTQPDLTIGDSLFHITNTYTLNNGGYFITAEIEFLKQVSINYWGMYQRGFYNPIKTVGNPLYDNSLTDSYKRYIPKMLPINVGYPGGTSDFRMGVTLDIPWTVENIANSGNFETPTSPPDRCYDIIHNSSGFKAGSLIAYLPIGVGFPNRQNNVSSAWYLYTSMKNYPFVIDSILNVNGAVPIGTYKQGVVASRWVNLEDEANRTFHTFIEYEDVLYLYVDYHATVIDKISTPDSYRGKRVSVVEKSSNVNILTDIVTDSVRLSCTIGTPGYGYAVLKLT